MIHISYLHLCGLIADGGSVWEGMEKALANE